MTTVGALYQLAEACPKGVAFIKGETVWPYERLVAEVDQLAHGLVRHGVGKGDRVALHLANGPELITAYYACFRVGAIAAPLNIRFKASELSSLLQRLQPSLYIGQVDLYSQVALIDSSVLAANRRFVVGGAVEDICAQPWTKLFADVVGEPVLAAPDLDAPAVLIATSGTTGRPKFVIHAALTLSNIANSFENWDLDGEQIAILGCTGGARSWRNIP